MENNEKFTFELSLSVLNHLGRHLYRSFVTILGEAISNSWDAEAKNVRIYIDRKNNSFVIVDDGDGMTTEDFQGKFLNIGYTKRKALGETSGSGRPFIGRKGIGKLALLSCAEKITVASKTKETSFIGGTINNPGLDEAINDGLKPEKYPLEKLDLEKLEPYISKDYEKGTIIFFENIKGGIKNTLGLIKKIIALYFRFSLLDKDFKIFIDNEEITYKNLETLSEKTQFLWLINKIDDPYLTDLLKRKDETLKEIKELSVPSSITGFVASVKHYKDLGIMNLEEKVGIDLFVNGRLRERDILKHISKSRLVESYLYGQIHYNELDEKEIDRFTSSREGITPDDEKYQNFLTEIDEKILKIVIKDWDDWRRKHRDTGDPENLTITPKQRKSEELFNVVSEEYTLPKESENHKLVRGWVNNLGEDAAFNFTSYAECFISENLIRKFIEEKPVTISLEAQEEINKFKIKETANKNKGNISIDIRQNNSDISYLSMDGLAYLVDKRDPITEACLARDANEYKPMRDAIAHTALLTNEAKSKLSSVYENIKSRVRTLLS
jgi:hypothetical protein